MKMKNDSLISNTPFDWLTPIGDSLKKEKKKRKFLKEVTQGKNSIDVELKFIWNVNNFYDFNEFFFSINILKISSRFRSNFRRP